jgi:hypothetical protein
MKTLMMKMTLEEPETTTTTKPAIAKNAYQNITQS